jgi:Na+/melibiose symporter-like transporter
LFAVGRLWDAVIDPIIGPWSDRTRTSLGRRRPFMAAAIPLLALTFLMLWMPPAALSPGWATAWLAIGLFGFYTAFSAYGIPHFALGAELVEGYHDRSRVYGVRNAAFMLGLIPAFAGLQLVNNAAEPRAAAAFVALGAALVMAAALVLPLRIGERADFQRLESSGSLAAIADVLRNRHARRIVSVQFIDSLGVGVLGVLGPYLAQYVLERPDLIAALPAVYTGCLLASIPLWVMASRRFGKREVWLVAMVGAALSFGATVAVGENDVALLACLLVAAGFFGGCGGPIGASMLADVIDADELATRQRKEGAYTAAFTFAFQVGSGLTVALVGAALELSGFQPNAEQTPLAAWTMRGLFAGMPLAMMLLGALVLRGYALDENEHARIRARLVETRGT